MTTPGLSWAVRESLIAYVEGLADGTVEALAPARREDSAFWFPLAEPTEPGHLQFHGAVRLTGHWGALDVELRDPRVVLEGATGMLHVRERAKPEAWLAFAEVVFQESDSPQGAGPSLVATVALTGAGSFLLGGQYPGGERLSPLRITLPDG